jgi:hypothetical protein
MLSKDAGAGSNVRPRGFDPAPAAGDATKFGAALGLIRLQSPSGPLLIRGQYGFLARARDVLRTNF